MKCNKDCLNCTLIRCIHDIEDRLEYVNDIEKKKAKKRKAEWYKENKTRIDVKQKEYDKKHRTSATCHAWYTAHKEEIKEKNRLRYLQHRKERCEKAKQRYWENREEISRKRKEKRDADKRRKIESACGES